MTSVNISGWVIIKLSYVFILLLLVKSVKWSVMWISFYSDSQTCVCVCVFRALLAPLLLFLVGSLFVLWVNLFWRVVGSEWHSGFSQVSHSICLKRVSNSSPKARPVMEETGVWCVWWSPVSGPVCHYRPRLLSSRLIHTDSDLQPLLSTDWHHVKSLWTADLSAVGL